MPPRPRAPMIGEARMFGIPFSLVILGLGLLVLLVVALAVLLIFGSRK